MRILFFCVFIISAGCSEKIEPGNIKKENRKIVKASVAVASISKQPFLYEAVGTVNARTTSTISGEIMGAVKSIHVREGDFVEKGDLLVELDDRQVSANLRKAEAGLKEARRALKSAQSSRESAVAGAELAKSTFNRYKILLNEKSVSRQKYDEVDARYRQSKASLNQTQELIEAGKHRVQQAEASVESAKARKKDANVIAPYSGKITLKMIDIGDLVSPGTPILTLEKKGAFCVTLDIPEEHIESIRLGQKASVSIPSLQEESVKGIVGRIDPAADKKSRSFRIKVALPDNQKFRSGVFARVAIPVGEAGMILIPENSVLRNGQLTGFYLVDEKNIVHFRIIRTGRVFKDLIEVISGIRAGDRYIVAPSPEIEDGVILGTAK
ncbi:MAG: efflux RND transporter periplasmic adaptor subunit [Desulfobacterales bacterium]|nr:efflux RND transporter periplasmic adaptor subunit [Desulfobacteraceae bacterium]MBT4365200.1 efflux RND transporter periplasmic adaptor subunit [Desulfobacteraceae bacterium]MBT7085506.1 efflux RND transporter periplasmic adaptor subunit [Desulfobacterales bacterium]MBT7696001.1 efflux RND transporter periplasmic adaptor subunit [Desulfobacterales bacterium]